MMDTERNYYSVLERVQNYAPTMVLFYLIFVIASIWALLCGMFDIDWKSKNEAAILTEIQRQTDGSIILMHDIHSQTSVNSLPVIEYLQDKGMGFSHSLWVTRES